MFAAIHCKMRMKRTNACSYTHTDMGRCRVQYESLCLAAAAWSWFGRLPHGPDIHKEGASPCTVSLADYVCNNPFHDESETHALRKSSRLYVCFHRSNDDGFLWLIDVSPSWPIRSPCTVSLVDYVCSNPLHEESETHERMFLRTDMGMSASIHCMIITNGCGLGIISAVICVAQW